MGEGGIAMRPVVILAAGEGKRLRPLTSRASKVLLDIGGTTILENALQNLLFLGYERIFLVTGHGAPRVRRVCKQFEDRLTVTCIHNERYKSTNNIYSLWLLRDYIRNGFVLLNGDVVFGQRLLTKIKHSDNVLLVDRRKQLGAEEMKVIVHDGAISQIGKDLPPQLSDGEYIGIACFTADVAKTLTWTLDEHIKHGNTQVWYEAALQEVFTKHKVAAVWTDGEPWIEIDNGDDLESATKVIYPDIRRRDAV